MLPWAVLAHTAIAIWVFSVPELFDYEDQVVAGGLNETALAKAARDVNRTVPEGFIPMAGAGGPFPDYWGPDLEDQFTVMSNVRARRERERVESVQKGLKIGCTTLTS